MGILMNADRTVIEVEVINAADFHRKFIHKEAARGYAEAHLVYDSREARPSYAERLVGAKWDKPAVVCGVMVTLASAVVTVVMGGALCL